jgi:DnaJ-domain-containing protein 1
VIKSYLNQEDERIFGRSPRGDPDLEEAEAELDRFLRDEGTWTGNRRNGGEAWSDTGRRNRSAGGAWSDGKSTGGGGAWGDGKTTGGSGAWTDGRTWDRAGGGTGNREGGGGTRQGTAAGPPEELRPDFAELGLPFGAGAEDCKTAYKRLLKLHHPDRHAGHEGNMKKATEKATRINAAYDRIEKWRTKQP